jgi:uncharacterized cupredoxin-like copper-binding protein
MRTAMIGPCLLAFFPLLAAPMAAPAPHWAGAERVEVRMSNFAFTPRTIRLRAGRPALLHLVNAAGGGHDFTAREFFAASAIRAEDRGAAPGGEVELGGGQSRDILLVPRAGRYPVKCTHRFHKLLGMTGEIVVG